MCIHLYMDMSWGHCHAHTALFKLQIMPFSIYRLYVFLVRICLCTQKFCKKNCATLSFWVVLVSLTIWPVIRIKGSDGVRRLGHDIYHWNGNVASVHHLNVQIYAGGIATPSVQINGNAETFTCDFHIDIKKKYLKKKITDVTWRLGHGICFEMGMLKDSPVIFISSFIFYLILSIF